MSFKKTGSLFLVLLLTMVSMAKEEKSLSQLKQSEYGKWEHLFDRDSAISNNGQFVAYRVLRNNGKDELRLHNLKKEKVDIFKEGHRAVFSEDNKWLGYLINVPEKKAKKLKKSKKPVHKKFALLNLATGKSVTFEDVSSFSFSGDGHAVAMKHYKIKGQKHKGSDLVVRNLNTAKDFNFGNISEFKWQDKGSLLALIISANGKAGNGVQLFNPKTGVIDVLDSYKTTYKGLQWRKKSADLAVYRDEESKDFESNSHQILLWKNLLKGNSKTQIFDHSKVENFNELSMIDGNFSLKWKKDGSAIYFATKGRIKKDKKEEKSKDEQAKDEKKKDKLAKKEDSKTKSNKNEEEETEAPDLQIWHSKDVKIIPEQIQIDKRNRGRNYLAIWHIKENVYVQLTNDLVESHRLQDDIDFVIGLDKTPYEFDAMFGRGNSDIYTINIKNGQKEKLKEKLNSIYSVSPDGKNLIYLLDNHYFVLDIKSKKNLNITQGLDGQFINVDDDHPVKQKPAYGFIAWAKNSQSFFVHSKYDIWQFWVNGEKGQAITNGAAKKIRHRYQRIDKEQKYIDPDKKMIVSLYGEWDKKSGYASVELGKKKQNVLYLNKHISAIKKAKNKDKYIFVIQDFNDSPDFFQSGQNFVKNKQISNTNPFQKNYHWGKSELINYTNANGRKLQGALFYPANYIKGKKYPMITYIYEKLSQGVHRYSVPEKRHYYSHGTWSQEGYFVLQPDIVFDAGDPGISSVKTLEIAVKTVVDMGLVDEKRVGLVGHSWGGYQAAFAVTNTDIFASVVAGAGLTDLFSMYGMVAWAFGGAPESEHFEVSQERMKVAPWRDLKGYIRNSPVMNVMDIKTPLLFEVGDADKNVDWRQGIEYYNAARREGKEMILLVYAKEGHGLRQKKNAEDYQQRILDWFDHYLKGNEAKDWVKTGIPYAEQQRKLKNWNKKKKNKGHVVAF